VLIEAGGIAGDFPVNLKRPRQRGSTDFAHIEAAILERLLAPAS
jgi:sulfonate transport system ATP-binding protein